MSRIMPIISQVANEHRPMLIATHSGKFHLDELIAITLVKLVADLFRVDIEIKRTRDQFVMDKADIVLDVSGLNEGKYFDHHGSTFSEMHHAHPQFKLATAGIVWYDLKEHILFAILRSHSNKPIVENIVYDYIYRRIILPSDIEDNGQGRTIYGQPMTINEIVNSFNVVGPEQDNQFFRALRTVQLILQNKLREIVNIAVEDDRIYQAIIDSPEMDKRDGILVLPQMGPWLSAVRRHWNDCRHLKVCIYGDPNVDGVWKIQTMPGDRYDKFKQRCSAPTNLLGYNCDRCDDPRIAGVFADKLTFVHSNGFIGAIRGNIADAKNFARYWIENSSTPPYHIPTEEEYRYRHHADEVDTEDE